ncbi:MAG: response regulator [Deltaproteobacteria bacterium]|nr:response regulator [Deltaproteobacteria bacterium]
MSKQIFLVEDDVDHAELITTFLKVGGIENEVIWFRDAESTIEYIHKVEAGEEDFPSLIIIDIKLPKMDGFQLIAYIRNIDKFTNIPIIVISSSSRPSDITRAMDLGAQEVLNKLAEMDKLSSKIKSYI